MIQFLLHIAHWHCLQGNYLHLVVASQVADHDHSAKHCHVLQWTRTLQIIFWIASLLLYLEYCPWKAAAHAIPEDVYLWWIWVWLWWWQYRWGFSLVKMLLIMLMIYVWQRCWVSGCLVGCFSKNHIFLHSPLFKNRATAKWPIRTFCLLVPQVQLCWGQITALILKLCLVSPFSLPMERFYVLVSLPLPKSIIKASLTAGAVREHLRQSW